MLNHPDQMFFGHVAFYAIIFCYICGMVIYHNLITLAKNDTSVDISEKQRFLKKGKHHVCRRKYARTI